MFDDFTRFPFDPALLIRERNLGSGRGAVFRYDFDEPGHRRGEVYKQNRPVVLMDSAPLTRLANRLCLHVVPCSTKPAEAESSVAVTLAEVLRSAVICQATTVDPARLGSFVGTLNRDDLWTLSKRLWKEFHSPKRGSEDDIMAPANLFGLTLPGNTEPRTVCIVGTGHLANMRKPVHVVVVPDGQDSERFSHAEMMYPVGGTRFTKENHLGVAKLGEISRVRQILRTSFGL